jgi:hypothetical protein
MDGRRRFGLELVSVLGLAAIALAIYQWSPIWALAYAGLTVFVLAEIRLLKK